MKILVINGPNMNMLGIREREIYGAESYEDLKTLIKSHADELGADVCFFQSNHEGAIIDAIQNAYFEGVSFIIINPAAYTHTSIAIADALKAVSIPAAEVHISAIENREAFRQISYVRDCCEISVSGKGLAGYNIAIDYLMEKYGNKHDGNNKSL